MDLSALLAREGIQGDDAAALVAWARQRAAALVARIEPDSELAQQLGAVLERARDGQSANAADAPVPVPRQPSRSAPRSMARQVSKPHLGAAVQAALTRDEPALDRVLETVDDLEISVDEVPPAPEPAPPPAAVEDEEDASIGGFNRFAFSLRKRAMDSRSQEDEAPRATLTHGFELEARHSGSSGAWQSSEILPAPPGFENRPPAHLPTGQPEDGETSGGLVVGIPDDESIDIPLPRARPRSAATEVVDDEPAPSLAVTDDEPAPSLAVHDDEPAPSLAVHDDEPAPSLAVTDDEPAPSLAVRDDEPQAARSSELLDLGAIELDLPEPPPREARPVSSPHRAAPPPPPPRSGPHAAARPPSAPTSAAPASRPAPQPMLVPQPAPKSGARGRKSSTAEHAQVKAEAKPAASKRGKGRKKVVELGQPVARKASIGNHQPTGEPSSASPQVPAYLQDDDE